MGEKTKKQLPNENDNKKIDNRFRVWKAIVYEDSAIPDWQKQLDDLGIMAAVSPKHNRDVWEQKDIDKIDIDTYVGQLPEEGDPKKPHWHLVLVFSGKKSYEQVYALLKTLAIDGKAARPKVGNEIRSAVRYLIHIDHKEKAQYLKSEVKYFGGFDGEMYFHLTVEQENQVFDSIMQLIIDHELFEYWDLMFLLRLLQYKTLLYQEMYLYCRKHPNVVYSLMKSRRFGACNKERGKNVEEKEMEERASKNKIGIVADKLTEVKK